MPWAADNGCYNGFNEPRWLRMLARLPLGGLFVVVPDVVADHAATMEMWHRWAPVVIAAGHRPGFVLQDGCDAIPPDAAAVFVGGSDEFKLGRQAADLVAQAKRKGLWAHMGRVNSRKRLKYAHAIGCDSVDGTAVSMFPDIKLPKMLLWAERAQMQLEMFGWNG